MEKTRAYEIVNKAFRDTSRVLFKEEIGELADFEEYLKDCIFPFQILKSHVSGKGVMVPSYYPQKAKIFSQDELERVKMEPLNINQVKDVDSLLEAVSENVKYCGNRVFGKNMNVEYVDNCIDSMNVLYSLSAWKCKNAAFTSNMRDSENVFGATLNSSSKFLIHCYHGIHDTRCFGSFFAVESSDCYSCFNCTNCSDALFSFNLKAKRNVVGNLELPKEKYLGIKEKVVGEIAEWLREKKSFPAVEEIPVLYGGVKKGHVEVDALPPAKDIEGINSCFNTASRLVLGRELGEITDYEKWLVKYSARVKQVEGAFGKPALSVERWVKFDSVPGERLVGLEEALKIGREKRISIEEGEELGVEELMRKVAKDVAYFSCEYTDGKSEKIVQCMISYDANTAFRVVDCTGGKKCAYCSLPAYSEHIYGGAHMRLFHSKFCINCFDSVNLNNCFEVDNCHDTSHSMFCHNCENVSDCLLCFNVKNKKYAVGNTEVGREEFMRVKKILLDYVVGALEKKKRCELGIFNIRKEKEGKGKG
jgi:hypothetical protein